MISDSDIALAALYFARHERCFIRLAGLISRAEWPPFTSDFGPSIWRRHADVLPRLARNALHQERLIGFELYRRLPPKYSPYFTGEAKWGYNVLERHVCFILIWRREKRDDILVSLSRCSTLWYLSDEYSLLMVAFLLPLSAGNRHQPLAPPW